MLGRCGIANYLMNLRKNSYPKRRKGLWSGSASGKRGSVDKWSCPVNLNGENGAEKGRNKFEGRKQR